MFGCVDGLGRRIQAATRSQETPRSQVRAPLAQHSSNGCAGFARPAMFNDLHANHFSDVPYPLPAVCLRSVDDIANDFRTSIMARSSGAGPGTSESRGARMTLERCIDVVAFGFLDTIRCESKQKGRRS